MELFYRRDPKAREEAERTVRSLVGSMGGKVHSSCVLDEIAYHGLSAELPPSQIHLLLSEDRDNIALAKADQIMFFRPIPQCMPDVTGEEMAFDADEVHPAAPAFKAPIVALLDGVPLENHSLLANHLAFDDPEDFASNYPAKERVHGTEMASLIIYGDLNDPEATPMDRPLYVRPVMKNRFGGEGFPEGVLLVDLLHGAVRRMLEGDGNNPPTAPGVKVINLSLGDPMRQYLNSVSPVARLLDWLSWKYRVLFIVSAGNVLNLRIDGETDISALSIEDRTQVVVDAVSSSRRNRRLFSPAESVNSLTVGALNSDHTEPNKPYPGFDPVEFGIPSPVSALGPGVARAIKPEILLPGGRLQVISVSHDGMLQWGEQKVNGPGCLAACPRSATPTRGRGYCMGTSVSTALASHAAGYLYEVLDDAFLLNGEAGIPDEYTALIIKAMLVHGADWSSLERAMDYYGINRRTAARWLGYGVPDLKRVEQCAERRVTAIGFGSLKNSKAHDYRFPFPVDLHGGIFHRRLVVTLASFTPTAVDRQEYRKAQVWFTLEGDSTKRLVAQRENTDWQAVLRGTLQHEIFSGSAPIPWDTNDEIHIKVNCRQGTTTGAIGAEVPYALLITAEIAEPIVGDLYAAVASRIRGRVNVMAQD